MLTIDIPDELPLQQAAAFLGISVATLRNWRRLGHIHSTQARPMTFKADEIRCLATRIAVGEFPRLRSRANKTACVRTAKAYAADPKLARICAKLSRASSERGFSVTPMLYLAAWRILAQAGEVKNTDTPIPFCQTRWRRVGVAAIMDRWRGRIIRRFREDEFRLLDNVAALAPSGSFDERLGALRHALSPAGRKARQGAFNTPLTHVAEAVAHLPLASDTFLDPCCGDGRFLVLAGKQLNVGPERLVGYDMDPDAAAIAGLNLLLAYPQRDFHPQVHCLDFLATPNDRLPDVPQGGFWAIATNPPWGARGAGNAVGCKLQHQESFAMFLERGLQLLREDGELSFFLPESVLNTQKYADLRHMVRKTTRLYRIKWLGKSFPGVFTPAIRVDIGKGMPEPESKSEFVRKTGVERVEQRSLNEDGGHPLLRKTDKNSEALLQHIFNQSAFKLDSHADWALGLVTGDNKRYVRDLPAADTVPVARGKDVVRYGRLAPGAHLRFRPEAFQQVAPRRIYEAPEKLVYRFISSELVFTYDSTRMLTLNSANIIIPRLPGYTAKAALAFFNSAVFRFVYSHLSPGLKVLKSALQQLPFPYLSEERSEHLDALVAQRLGGDEAVEEELERQVFSAFGLDDKAISRIRRFR